MDNFELSDEELIFKFQNGNRQAYTMLVNRYKDKIKNYLFRFVHDEVAAEDLTQDTFLKFYQKKDSYRQIAKFSTWLYTIASNLAKTELRKIKRRKTYTMSDLQGEDKLEMQISDKSKVENTDSIQEKIINNSLMELSQEFRNIIIMREIQELSYESISKILELPLGTVKSRINRGRFKLKDLLKQKGVVLY